MTLLPLWLCVCVFVCARALLSPSPFPCPSQMYRVHKSMVPSPALGRAPPPLLSTMAVPHLASQWRAPPPQRSAVPQRSPAKEVTSIQEMETAGTYSAALGHRHPK